MAATAIWGQQFEPGPELQSEPEPEPVLDEACGSSLQYFAWGGDFQFFRNAGEFIVRDVCMQCRGERESEGEGRRRVACMAVHLA